MIELNASISSYSRKQVSIESQYQRQSISVSKGQGGDKPDILNGSNQENQITDELDISAAAIEKLNEAKALSDQIKAYLDYLNGETPQNVVLVKPSNDNDNIRIEAQSVEASASISYTETTATQTDINARFTDDGQLIDLEINQIRVSERELNVDLQSRILDLSIAA